MLKLDEIKIGIIGLGYVGLPLAVEFSKKYSVVGFDTNTKRIQELMSGVDSTLELNDAELKKAKFLDFTSEIKGLLNCNCYIVTVPTPITKSKQPDLNPLINASKAIASVLSKGNIVVYESTVYPGATEEICIPILENISNFTLNKEFYVGYSPERINPGDRDHRLTNIVKVTSGSNKEATDFVDSLYASIVDAGTFKASSIMVAEAAKVIENTQRDINIALVNELAIIFNKLDIDTEEVLKAAGSKWNFLPFRPGLVGGHCIGVDPYYLTYKAQSEGYDPRMILSGRKINDEMGSYAAKNLIKHMCNKKIDISNAKVLIMGFSFKENCPDIRNTKILDIYEELKSYSLHVDIFDPWVDKEEANNLYGINIIDKPDCNFYDAAIVAVAHDNFKEIGFDGINSFLKERNVIYDLKYVIENKNSVIRL